MLFMVLCNIQREMKVVEGAYCSSEEKFGVEGGEGMS